MKNRYFKIFLLFSLLLAFGTAVSAQKTKRPKKGKTYKMIISNDFDAPTVVTTTVKKKKAQRGKKWRKRCRWTTYRRYGRTVRVRRCRWVR